MGRPLGSKNVRALNLTPEQWRERKRAQRAILRRNNPEQFKAYGKKAYHKDPAKSRLKSRGYRLKRKYGITEVEYDAMWKAQDGKCAMCLKPQSPHKKLHVDHNHATGKCRFLLCLQCNVWLHVLENLEFREMAEAYLNFHRDGGGSYNDYVAIITNGKTCVNGKVYRG